MTSNDNSQECYDVVLYYHVHAPSREELGHALAQAVMESLAHVPTMILDWRTNDPNFRSDACEQQGHETYDGCEVWANFALGRRTLDGDITVPGAMLPW